MSALVMLAVFVLVFLNGATDASGAIASAVSSGAISMRRAALLAACGNTAGGVSAALLFGGIGDAVADAADFGAFGIPGVLACLAAAVIFTAAAWMLHLPTSESHALLAAAAGVRAATAGEGILTALAPAALWMTLCTAGGFVMGVLLPRCLPKRLSESAVRRLQIASAFAASYLHGVQDLPKFLAFLSVAGFSHSPALWCAAVSVIALGTLLGGRRMTEAVGTDLAALTPCGALASDFGAGGVLLILSVCGVPASTTHAKTAAVAGAAFGADGCALHWRQFVRFLVVWALTFPLCAALAYVCARVALFAF